MPAASIRKIIGRMIIDSAFKAAMLGENRGETIKRYDLTVKEAEQIKEISVKTDEEFYIALEKIADASLPSEGKIK